MCAAHPGAPAGSQALEKQGQEQEKSENGTDGHRLRQKTSDYDKLFKGKKCQTVKGLVTIHKVDGEKLYFELPMSIFGREMLLGSTVSRPATTTTA